jgi:ligand-binding sensor domain-containing protein
MRRRSLAAPLLAGGVVVMLAALAPAWRAFRALSDSAAEVSSEGEVRFGFRTPGSGTGAGFETISGPAHFRDVREFAGRLVLCGDGGLYEYGENGELTARYRVGLELPPAPLIAMAASGGELWIATRGEGLLNWDGRRFRHLRPAEPRHRDVTSLLPLTTGGLLFGTRGGVLRFDGRRLRVFHPSLARADVTALAGEESDLWVGTLEAGLWRLLAGRLEKFEESSGVADRRVTSLALWNETLWVGTPAGVAEFRDGVFQRQLARGFFARSLLPRQSDLLVGTLEEGVVRVALEPRHARAADVPGGSGPVEQLQQIGSAVFVLTADSLTPLDTSNSNVAPLSRSAAQLADANIAALASDPAGRLWIGYFDRGLDVFDTRTSRAAHHEDDQVFCVNRVAVEPGGATIAVATANGMVLFDRSATRRNALTRQEGLIASHVTDVAFTPGGIVAATPAGITFLDGAGPRSLFAFHGLVNNHVYSLAWAGGRLLAGTLGGLSVLEGEVVRAGFTTANSSLRHNWITALAALDSSGEDWFVGTYGAGVLRFDGVSGWTQFPDLPRDFVVNPNAMLVTGRAVYAGSLGQGLAVWSRSRTRWRWITDGLPSLNVTAVAEHAGALYIGTANGLVRVAEASLGVE